MYELIPHMSLVASDVGAVLVSGTNGIQYNIWINVCQYTCQGWEVLSILWSDNQFLFNEVMDQIGTITFRGKNKGTVVLRAGPL